MASVISAAIVAINFLLYEYSKLWRESARQREHVQTNTVWC
jgi:hypothetical protein